MKSSELLDKLAPALAMAQTQVRVAGKSGDNKFDKYTYAKVEDFIGACEKALEANKLAVLVGAGAIEAQGQRTTKNGGTEYWILIRYSGVLLHESGQWIEIDAIGSGQDRGDKGAYKAATGARKYAMAQLFNLKTTDEPEDDKGDDDAPQPGRNNSQAVKKPAAAPAKKDAGPSLRAKVLGQLAAWVEIQDMKSDEFGSVVATARKAAGIEGEGKLTDPQLLKLGEWMAAKKGKTFQEAIE